MIVVTLFCVTIGGYVSWQAKIVRERRALAQADGITGMKYSISEGKPTWLRWKFGDRMYDYFELFDSASDETVNHYKSVFPEALVIRRSDPRNPYRYVPDAAEPSPTEKTATH